MTAPVVFPTLVGLGYSVVKRPIFYNGSAKSGSGWSIDVAYAFTPTWEWDLYFEVLTDPNATSDLKKLLGFYLGMNGNLVRFLFLDPDDNAVVAQTVGTTDGLTTDWVLQRTYGYVVTGTENIGYVNLGETFNLYLDAVLQSSGTYDVVTTTAGQQTIHFHSAPATGKVITVDMSYYYYVKFKDPSYDFEKFADKYWTVKKVTLASVRG